jgi:hypothetical protein
MNDAALALSINHLKDNDLWKLPLQVCTWALGHSTNDRIVNSLSEKKKIIYSAPLFSKNQDTPDKT